ncbi:MAG: xanthine dehydrogenase accessory protein XdhC [Planctomycetales bacterium]|nr:xanthine dehydrogenase accessory protein XdhC [Planctomycetales bacterium]
MPLDIVEHTRALQKLFDSGQSFVEITLCAIRGSAPQIAGAKAVVTRDGIEAGTIGGGKIEAASIRYAQELLSNKENCDPELITWNLQTDIGMTCGGEVTLFFSKHEQTTWPIAVFGAGHVAQALVPMLVQLNCYVSCIDPRSNWLDKLPDHAKLSKICTDSPASIVTQLPQATYFVLMSQGHATDLPVLAEILKTRSAPYVGVIGSEQKATVLRRDLASQGFSSDQISSFFCPIGLDFGNNTPTEIAISVIAQLIKVRDAMPNG